MVQLKGKRVKDRVQWDSEKFKARLQCEGERANKM